MLLKQVNSSAVFAEPKVWSTPHVVQKLRRDSTSWNELYQVLVEDLAFGSSPNQWVSRLLKEGNVGLACELAHQLGIWESQQDFCAAQGQEWLELYSAAKAEAENYRSQQEEDLGESEIEEFAELLATAENFVSERSYGDAISTVEQAYKQLETAVERRRMAIKKAFDAVSAKSQAQGYLLAATRPGKFPRGAALHGLANALLLQANQSLQLRDFSHADQVLQFVERLCSNEAIADWELDEWQKMVVASTPVPSAAGQAPEDFPVASSENSKPVEFEFDWQPDDDHYLIDNYDIMSNGQLRLRFNTSESDIEARIRYLGLTHDRQTKKRVHWHNPYVAGKPIRDKRVFVGRDDVFEFIRDGLALSSSESGSSDRNLIALLGHRRTGKTSILLQLKRNRRDVIEPRIPIFIDIEDLLPFPGGLRNFFYKLACRLYQELLDEDIEIAIPNEDDFKDPAWRFKEYLRTAERAAGGRGFVIMMDEFQALEPRISTLDVDVYKMLRSIIQHDTSVDFIVAGTMQMEQLMRDYQAAMFGSAISKRLDFLDEKDARKLILSPVKNYISYTKDAENLVIEVTACHPYFVQLVCWTLMRYLIDRGKAKVFASDVERILPQVVEQGVHFNEIWATDTTELELYLMAAISQLTTRHQDWCSIAKVEDALRYEDRLPRDPDDFNDAISNLVNRRILRYSNDGSTVRFQVSVFGQWVHTNKPLAVVKRDIQAQAAAMRRRVQRQPKSN